MKNLGRQAIATQLQQQAENFVNALLPRLHGLSITLTDAGSKLHRTDPLNEFQELIQTLNTDLEKALPPLPIPRIPPRALVVQRTIPNPPPRPILPLPAMVIPAKRTLRAPSPELRQRRNPSHSIL